MVVMGKHCGSMCYLAVVLIWCYWLPNTAC